MSDIEFKGTNVIILAILVLWIGNQITRRVGLLKKYSIPISVSGGLLCCITLALITRAGGPKFIFELAIRDTLLMVFFTTIGISAKFSRLRAGGKALGILVACAAVFLLVQNVTGVILAYAFGVHPGYGLFAGSISLAGGHGTAIAWGQEATAAGLKEANPIGITFATFGLIAGGIIGGPIAEYLIKKHKLTPTDSAPQIENNEDISDEKPPMLQRTLGVLFVLAICLSFGEVLNHWLFAINIKLPGFLTAMMIGIFVTNLAEYRKKPLCETDYNNVGEISLQLFLAMSLMSMNLSSVADAFGPIFLILNIQILVIALFSVFIIFRIMGKDYDAAVISGGFCGLGMGATPVAIANMNAVTSKYGPSFKAFLVIPLVGAFFIDLLNALIIKFFIGLEFMQQAAIPLS
ncbi:MAG: sodium/glutamate symporter [Blastopirellula sp.]|nr:MAG: sodium/glutamate symporter [Blastopirellula sp.]